jgi:group I intron endonuclease
MKLAGVYKIQNMATGKFYIGSSSVNIFYRFNRHISQLKNNKHFNSKLQNSFNKHGIDCFELSVLEFTADCLNREQHYIDSLKPFYNIAKVAGAPMAGRKHSKETIERCYMGKKSWNKGVPQTREARIKNVISNGGTFIKCNETGDIFISIMEAANKLGLYRSNIQQVLRGRLKTTGGHTFSRVGA